MSQKRSLLTFQNMVASVEW